MSDQDRRDEIDRLLEELRRTDRALPKALDRQIKESRMEFARIDERFDQLEAKLDRLLSYFDIADRDARD